MTALDSRGNSRGSTTTDADGRYTLALAPGTYTLRVTSKGPLPRCPDTVVTVRPGEQAAADVHCDTGIR